MKWDGGLEKVARMPKRLHDKFDDSYAAAPLMTNR